MIHLVGLPHTKFDDKKYSNCAFTSKSVRLAEILHSLGEPFHLYWGGMDRILSHDRQEHYFGTYNPAALPAVEWDPNLPYWQEFNRNCIKWIKEFWQPQDIIMLTGGRIHEAVAQAFPGQIIIEPMVGYEGPLRNTWWATESYAWLYNRYGAYGINDHRQFDTVIPPYQRAEDFTTGNNDGYLLYLGRHMMRKGVSAAGDIASAIGLPLITAGNGVATAEKGLITCTDGTQIRGDVSYVGPVTPKQRKGLLAHASALIFPTTYIEPGGTVHIEALLSGVPVIAADGSGAVTDTLPREWRYRSLGGAVSAFNHAIKHRGEDLRQDAISKYSLEAVAPLHAEWLARLRTLWEDGWYTL